MKVLVINTVEFGLNGISSVIMNYYRQMKKNDIAFDFIAVNKIEEIYLNEMLSNGSKVYKLNRKKDLLKYCTKLYEIMKRNRYDIVHIHGNSATVSIETTISYIVKIPVRIVHSHNTTCSNKKLHKLLYPIMKKTYTHGFACGEDAGKWLFKDESFEVIKNGIDLNKFIYDRGISEKYKKKINSINKIVIAHVGNFVEQKNHTFIIDMFYELLEKNKIYKLMLIGDGPLMSQIIEKVNLLGINDSVEFVGKTTEVNKYLQAADIFILPSHYEGLPVVSIESQALGIPCLLSNNVSKEAKITELVEFLDVDTPISWVKNILGKSSYKKLDNISYHKYIKKNGYDIVFNAYNMQELYKKYLHETTKK